MGEGEGEGEGENTPRTDRSEEDESEEDELEENQSEKDKLEEDDGTLGADWNSGVSSGPLGGSLRMVFNSSRVTCPVDWKQRM